MTTNTACPHQDTTLLLAVGELPGPEEVEATEHLRSCSACQAVQGSLHMVEREYGMVPVPSLDGRQVDEILQRAMLSNPPVDVATLPPARSRLIVPPRWMVGAAAAAVVVTGSFALVTRRGAGVGVRSGSSSQVAITEMASLSPIERLRLIDDVGRGSSTDVEGLQLVDLLEEESNPNVRLAILDALGRIDSGGDPRLLVILARESIAPLRADLLTLLVRHRVPGVRAVAERMVATDGSAAVRARAARILAEM